MAGQGPNPLPHGMGINLPPVLPHVFFFFLVANLVLIILFFLIFKEKGLLPSLLTGFLGCGLTWHFGRRWARQLQERVEHVLRQGMENLDFALQSGRMGTWEISLQDRSISCSQEMLDLWGIQQEDLNGQRSLFQSKVHPEDVEKMNSAIDSAITKGSIYELEFRIHPSPGLERWVLSRGRCSFSLDTGQPIRFSGVVYDITDRKMKEEALAAAIMARDQFLSIAGHELKTPLTSLQLQMQLQQRNLKKTGPEAMTWEKWEAALKIQYEYVQRIGRLVDDILDVSRISEGRLVMNFGLVDLGEMVGEVLQRFQVIAEASEVEIQFRPCQNIQGRWDRFRLEQVLLNLLTNALKYGRKRPLHVDAYQEGLHAFMIVKDEGIGIRTEDQARVFERFERAISENEVSGMGLGLYISRKIVEAHGGKIQLKSEFGKGSEFSVVIPLYHNPNLAGPQDKTQ